jgi:anti-sigma regulatory factor (Ser/Thr protein kinase)
MANAREAFAGHPQIEVNGASPGWTRLHFPATRESREIVTAYLRGELADLPTDLCEHLALAVDELLGNAIEHGGKRDSGGKVAFSLLRTPRMLLFYVGDAGPGFSLDAIEHAAVSNPPGDPLHHAQVRNQMGMRPGGFGILLVKQIADELIYSEQGNEVVLVKYLDRDSANGGVPKAR